MEPFRFHLFVCTQQKPEGVTSCPANGAMAVLSAFDREIRTRRLSNEVQLTTCGCMGLCDEGPVMVVYPSGVWYRKIKASDVPEIIESHLVGDNPVNRLVWDDAAAMKSISVEHNEKFRAVMAARDKAGILPEALEQTIRSFMPSRCILTALELDVFTAVGEGATAESVATKMGADPRATAMLLNAVVSLGLLTKTADVYRNTAESARFFTQGSKSNHRNGLLHTANIWHRWSTLTEAVRRGTRVPIEQSEKPDWTKNFIAGMQRNSKDRAPLVVKIVGTEGVRRVLDLGGGSGSYSIAFAKASSEIQCDILDVPDVVPMTKDYVERAGVTNQVKVRAGDMLHGDFGSGFNLIMLNAICHMFSDQQNKDLFRHAHRALARNGRLVMQDFILNPAKTAPQQAALFSLNMLVGTESGASYSEPEYTDWMRAAGFREVKRINLPGPSDLIVGTK